MGETDTQLKVDYDAVAKQLKEAANRPEFWNGQPGKHEVIALSEMSHYEYPNKKEPGIIEKRAKIDVEVAGKQYCWSFGIGITEASLYGQLVALAVKNGGKLIGQKFTVVIKSDGKKRDFTIV
jgi:hypothetical protein